MHIRHAILSYSCCQRRWDGCRRYRAPRCRCDLCRLLRPRVRDRYGWMPDLHDRNCCCARGHRRSCFFHDDPNRVRCHSCSECTSYPIHSGIPSSDPRACSSNNAIPTAWDDAISNNSMRNTRDCTRDHTSQCTKAHTSLCTKDNRMKNHHRMSRIPSQSQ